MATPEISWSAEIRDYLLGRLSTNRHVHELPASRRGRLATIPIRNWWLFEGKRYAGIDGPLCANWPIIRRSIVATMRTYNPTWRVSDRADGWIDWGRTLARCPGAHPREFVVQSSRAGLDEAERAALIGWIGWIREQWKEYAYRPEGTPLDPMHGLASEVQASQPASISRWAHIARRSRWPILRHVVAETLRVALELQEVERIPLPTDRATLFELLCMVRILRDLAPNPTSLRWLDPKLDDNTIAVDDLAVRYQPTFPQEHGRLAYSDVDGDALEVFDVRVPSRSDLIFDFGTQRRAGLDGILVEAKSGAQEFGETLEQLRVYRVAIRREPSRRLLVWGITENAPALRPDQLAWIRQRCSQSAGDVWVFSGIQDLPAVLRTVFGDGNDLGPASESYE